jgi:hypothetical protein
MIIITRIKFLFLCILVFSSFVVVPQLALSGDSLTVSRDFTLFTSKNFAGYLKPLFTTAEESFNTHLYTKAQYDDFWNIALDISVSGMFIPDKHKMYDAVLPEGYGITKDGILVVDNATIRPDGMKRQVGGTISQPTIYGGTSYAVFTAPQIPDRESLDDANGDGIPDSTFKTVAFPEGNNVDFMSGVPAIQIIAGIPTRTQLRFRFWGADVQDAFLHYVGVIVNQQIDQFFDLFKPDSSLGLALNFAWHNMGRSEGISLNSIALGTHFSKTWESGLSAFCGFQWETINGEFKAYREKSNPNDIANSPYIEIRDMQPVEFDIEGFNSWRLQGGLSFRTGIFEFHGEAAWAAQPILSAGLTLWIASWGEKKEQETIEQYEKIERIERIEKIEKKETIKK